MGQAAMACVEETGRTAEVIDLQAARERSGLPERLSDSDGNLLRTLWFDFEPACGVSCTHAQMVNRLNGIESSGHGQEMPAMLAGESASLRGVFRDSQIARRALMRLQAKGLDGCVTVLHRIYGPRPPGDMHKADFGDLGPLAEYTETVEAHRRMLVEARIVQMQAKSETAHERALARAAKSDDGAREIWEEVAGTSLRRDEEAPPQVIDWCGIFASIRVQAEREVTTGDALRAGLDLSGKERDVFVRAVRRDAEAVLRFASQKFREAKAAQ